MRSFVVNFGDMKSMESVISEMMNLNALHTFVSYYDIIEDTPYHRLAQNVISILELHAC